MSKDYAVLGEAERKAAERVTWGLDGTETDLVIAEAITDYLLASQLLTRPSIRLSVTADWQSFPLPFDWRAKCSVGIRTKDQKRAPRLVHEGTLGWLCRIPVLAFGWSSRQRRREHCGLSPATT